MMADFSIVTAFQAPFMRMTLGASLSSAQLLSYLGVFVLLRRTVFVGAALPQVSTAGAALALLAAGLWAPSHDVTAEWLRFAPAAGAAILTLLAIAIFTAAGHSRLLPTDGVIGAIYVLAAAGTILILNFIPHDQDEITPLITGNLLTVSQSDLRVLVLSALGIAAAQFLLFKEFLFTAFDPQVAETLGFKTRSWSFVWFLCLGIAIAAVTKAIGVHLAFAYLVLPGLAGLLIAKRLRGILAVAMAAAAIATVLGLWASYALPAAPTVVAAMLALLLLAAATRSSAGRRSTRWLRPG
jgi:zinc transport system permease protein